MALLNFKKRFVEPIRQGTKAHTIRADRKDGQVPESGEKLYLYCGARTKNCFKILAEPPACTNVQRILIERLANGDFSLFVDHSLLQPDECERLARADGFESFAEMKEFWKDRPFPFYGHIIHWKPL